MGNAGHRSSRTAGAAPAPGSRPARTKVSIPGTGDAATPSPPAKRPPVKKKPWYRQGRFWFAVIVVQLVAAWILSVAFTVTRDDVPLDGANLTAFCDQVRQTQAASSKAAGQGASLTSGELERQVAAYRALEPVAPTALRPDLDRLAKGTQQVADRARAVESGPDAAMHTAEVIAAQDRATTKMQLSGQRLDTAIRNGCGIDLDNPLPTTTVGPVASTVAPTTTVATGG